MNKVRGMAIRAQAASILMQFDLNLVNQTNHIPTYSERPLAAARGLSLHSSLSVPGVQVLHAGV